MDALLEICVDDPAGIAAAVAGGADRIELCAALELGGLTPSAALLALGVATGLPVHAMIRPRGGDFMLREGEISVMLDDIRHAIAHGAAGVVVGASLPGGRLDRDALARFRDAARDATIVLHRAIDLAPDPVAAVGEAIALGYDRILSSGGASTAIEGMATLARMVQAAQGRLTLIAGSGITPDNVARLIAETGVNEVHGSASAAGVAPDPKTILLGFAAGPRRHTRADIVRRMHAAITGPLLHGETML